MGKMWSGRFEGAQAELLDRFNASLPFDRKLYAQDIRGSQAHVAMLAKQGIVTQAEAETIHKGLEQIREEIERGEFVFEIADEDIHMAVEKRLTDIIGDVAKKLHTARSRNDQVATDFRLYLRDEAAVAQGLLRQLIATLLNLAEKHSQTLMPGMTHLQHAQPVSFAYHLLAYVAMFRRDDERLESTIARNNLSPLGCAALAGTPHPIDRQQTAESLGFDGVSLNCLDTVSDRDYPLEMLFDISLIMMHISRLSEELILWSTSEFGFVTIDDAYATGSSIMPQKKNPDVPELLRGKTGRVYGNLIGLLTVMKGLPLAYNKDTQEDKEGVFDSIETVQISLEILNATMATLVVNESAMQAAAQKGHLSATDLADYLVRECDVPFREAHFITGKAVAKAESLGIDLSQIEEAVLLEVDSRIKPGVTAVLGLNESMEARSSEGGTASGSVKKQIELFRHWLKEIETSGGQHA